MEPTARTRRRVLRTAAATVTASALIAGCTDEGGEETDEAEAEEGTGNGQEADDEENGEDDEDVAHEDDGDLGEDEEGDDASEDDEQDVTEADSWEDVEEILLATDEDVWVGEAPSVIEGEENPTLELTAGEEYDIGYVNRDADSHALAIWAEDAEREATEVTEEEDEQQWLTIEADEELTEYRCEVHPDTMTGEFEIADE